MKILLREDPQDNVNSDHLWVITNRVRRGVEVFAFHSSCLYTA